MPQKKVIYKNGTLEFIREHEKSLELYKTSTEMMEFIDQVLSQDISKRPDHILCSIKLDRLIIHFNNTNEGIDIEKIELNDTK